MSTLEEIWAESLPSATTLVGGSSGLATVVRGVSTLRGRQPGFAALRGGELALLSTQVLQQLDPRTTLGQALERLADAGVVAVAVQGEVDPVAATVADRRRLPLLLLPPESSLREVELRVARALMEHRAGLHDRTHRLQSQLQELLLDGRPAVDVADRLALLVGRTVTLEPTAGDPHIVMPRRPAIDRASLAAALEADRAVALAWAGEQRFSPPDPPVARFQLSGVPIARFAAPVALPRGVVGLLSILAPPAQLGELERLAASRGAATCALAMAHERALQATEDRMQRALMDELLGAGPLDVGALTGRAARLGYDLDAPHLALVVALEPASVRRNGHEPGDGPSRAIEALERELGADTAMVPLRAELDGLTALLPLAPDPGPELVRASIRRVHDGLSGGLRPWIVSIGAAGPRAGVGNLRAACREAERALQLGTQLFGAGRATRFEELGAFRVLFQMHGTPEADDFQEEMLGALEAYDREHRADLVSTLDAYFAAGCSPRETATRLHLHRNTVLYRLQRIADISGRRLDDPATRFAMQLALGLRRTGGSAVERTGARPAVRTAPWEARAVALSGLSPRRAPPLLCPENQAAGGSTW